MLSSNSIDVQRAALLDVMRALAAFGRQRAERRAAAGQCIGAQESQTNWSLTGPDDRVDNHQVTE